MAEGNRDVPKLGSWHCIPASSFSKVDEYIALGKPESFITSGHEDFQLRFIVGDESFGISFVKRAELHYILSVFQEDPTI
mmetsp:Transcript_44912/g.108536  ORF Transcript_44912/g.108536 Transcript_44912/m.108536 type:complete len:80 (+) Transcript_44912:2465-2704(+)